MAFEPLRTDEKLDTPIKSRDFDGVMLAGCSSFVGTSVLTYLLGLWPFFAIGDLHLTARMLTAAGLSFAQTVVFGAVMTRRTGLPGACGSIGGAMSLAVFIHLMIKQLMLGFVHVEIPDPDYSGYWAWLGPLSYCTVLTLVVAVLVPRREFQDEPMTTDSR